MKKLFTILVALAMVSFAFAEFPVNHNATLIPQKASLLSGGANALGFDTWNIEYTHGLKGTNLHVKASYGNRTVSVQGMVRHCILEWMDIDMGFGYGGEFEFYKRLGTTIWELSPLASWNMSHNFTNDVDFYGGVVGGFTFGYDSNRRIWDGTAWVPRRAYTELPIGLYYGTQIDIAKSLELYLEIQTGINDYASGAYLGVNYYIAKGIEIEKPVKK